MKKAFPFFIVVFSFLITAASAESLQDIEKNFAMPPAEYGSAPFWSWNDDLEAGELKRQIDEFKSGGNTGFFMHSRIGLITPYLSDEWMDMIRESVDYAKETGMLAYLYDEDGYPSGPAGGLTQQRDPSFFQQPLLMTAAEQPLDLDSLGYPVELLRVFEARIDGLNIESYKDVTPAHGKPVAPPAGGNTLLYFLVDHGRSEVDVLSRDAMAAFIEITHEAYRKAVGGEFGKTIPAIFTDEPMYHREATLDGFRSIPWTGEMPDYFFRKNGYDIREKLPIIYYNSPDSAKTRVDFWTTATEMFRDVYNRQIFEWCERNGIEYTGHHMGEENFITQTRWSGAVMPLYEFMQRPGIDHLGLNIDDPIAAKQVSSVAHQFGRPLITTELYGAGGWNMKLEDMKWIADWHYSLGVNFLVPHLSLYSARGCRKRDYPPSIFYQSPWWKYNKILGDYFRRASYINSRGENVADLLVIHPMTGAWAVNSPLDQSGMENICNRFITLINSLIANHFDYDLGDEIIIGRHGFSSDGLFGIKKKTYPVILIPGGSTLKTETISILKKFIGSGGKVIAIEPSPQTIGGGPALDADSIITAENQDAAVALIAPLLPHRVQITGSGTGDPGAVFVHQRRVDDGSLFFFANTDRENPVGIEALLPCSGRVTEWNLFDGGAHELPAREDGQKTLVELTLEPAGSIQLSVSDTEPSTVSIMPAEPVPAGSEELPEVWKIAGSDPNTLLIDFFDFKVEGDPEWATRKNFYEAKQDLESRADGKEFKLRYTFFIGFQPGADSGISIAVEQPEMYDITLNGKPIRYENAGWWHDISFRLIDIGGIAKKGKNVLEMEGVFKSPMIPGTKDFARGGMEAEAVYVVGDFTVRKNKKVGYAIMPPEKETKTRNLTGPGWPFFSGTIRLASEFNADPQTGEKYFIELDGFNCDVAEFSVNGKPAGVIAFHPYKIEVTDLVKSGSNSIEMSLTGNNRNLLGPQHSILKTFKYVSPRDFPETFTRGYNLNPFGVSKIVVSRYR
ncbi:MAG TPA: glycosyl hydrolase [bacterium]|nr:glycosyl hydrolase [bacterium]